jgi:NADPH-dependent curcumin reductase CurA
VWERLATDLKPRHLDRICTRTIGFDELPAAFPDYVAGKALGRTLVRVG